MIFQPVIKGGSSQSSLPTQTKTVTPGYLEQLVTKDPGYGDLRVIVEGDEDLLSKNIKKDVSIFGVTGSYVGGVEDRLQDVEAFPEPAKTLPNEAWLVTADGVQDLVPLFKEMEGLTITEILIVNDHTEVSNPVDVSATGAGPVYCDGTDVWIYVSEWIGLCGEEMTYHGIKATRPNNASAYGVYIVKGQTIPSTGTVNKDYVYKITTTKNHITFWIVMPAMDEETPAQVINFNEMAEAQGGKVEGEYRWGHPNDIKNPISSVESETELYLYFYIWTDGTTTGAWIYMDGQGWVDYMGMMGLPYNGGLYSPPTVDRAPGMYTTDETVVDKIKFGIPISEAELYQYIDKLSGSVYSGGKDLLESFAAIGSVGEYKTVETEADIDLSEQQYIYIIKSTNQYAFVVNGTSLYKSDVDGVVYDPADVPSTGTYICYNVQNEWKSIQEKIDELEETASDVMTYKNFFTYAKLTGSANGIELTSTYGSFESIRIHKSVTSIGTKAFNGRDLTSIIFDDDIELVSIGDEAFWECTSLASITIPNSVTSIGRRAFRKCSQLKSVSIPSSISRIYDGAFRDYDNLQYNIDNNVKYLGNIDYPYLCLVKATDMSITSYTISSQCRVIYTNDAFDGAFANCSNLTSVTIPNSVKMIGSDTFYNCSNLISITFEGTIAEWNAIEKEFSWDYQTGNYTIHCTDGDIAKE